jgi:hypothetical protein
MIGSTTHGSTERQPYEQTLRQESYTNDTDRSFPLAGGVAPKHDSSVSHPTEHHSTGHHTSSTLPPVQQTSSTAHPITSEREPGTKEKEAGVRDGHGREGLAGAAAAAAAIGVASHQRDSHDQGLNTRDPTHRTEPMTTSSTVSISPPILQIVARKVLQNAWFCNKSKMWYAPSYLSAWLTPCRFQHPALQATQRKALILKPWLLPPQRQPDLRACHPQHMLLALQLIPRLSLQQALLMLNRTILGIPIPDDPLVADQSPTAMSLEDSLRLPRMSQRHSFSTGMR